MNDKRKFRNFSNYSYIDPRKSHKLIASYKKDEKTQTVSDREMKAQLLDSMDLEREEPITNK